MRSIWIPLCLLTACEEALPDCDEAPTVPVEDCDPAEVEFSLASTNPWYPLHVGTQWTLQGIEDGIAMEVHREVLAETREVLGVDVHVLRHETRHDGAIHEVAYNFYVESTGGTVCYFGEDVEFYEDGALANTDGTWRAGDDGARPGVIMPPQPEVGQVYYQEMAPGAALDIGEVTQVGMSLDFDGQSWPMIQIMDRNPIDDEEACAAEEKRYAEGIGEVRDVALDLVAFTAPTR